MHRETRQKTVEYTVHVADDGKKFDNEQDCIHHDKIND